jgi:2-polyprenyl-3-methyl-5-hydroxy-6-metoxy-1,4-benzoquinol methylase
MVSDKNKHRFEYIWHLYNSNKTYDDLPFDKHVPCDPSLWQFPEHLIEYHRLVFGLGHAAFKDKKVLDIGCGISWYMGSMENTVKKYIGVDTDERCIKYARTMSKLVDIDAEIKVASAEEILCKADTIMMLSVTHQMPNVKDILQRFDCENIILDCWEDRNNIKMTDVISYLEDRGFTITEKKLYHYTDKKDLGEQQTYRGDRYILHFNRQSD